MTLKIFLTVNGGVSEFIVRDFNGNLVFYKRRIIGQNFFIFKTQATDLAFTVRPINADYNEQTKYFKLPCCNCCCFELVYNFTQGFTQKFTLTDANYGFPVKRATLYFTSV